MPKAPRARPPKLPPIPESEVQASAIAMLRFQGCVVHRRNTGASVVPAAGGSARRFIRFNEPGASDLWGLLPRDPGSCAGLSPARAGAHFELEVKRKGEKPTLDQITWLIDHNGIGSSVAWWSDSVDDAERVLLHVIRGGRIEYDTATRLYSVKVKGKVVKMPGPSGDFTLVS